MKTPTDQAGSHTFQCHFFILLAGLALLTVACGGLSDSSPESSGSDAVTTPSQGVTADQSDAREGDSLEVALEYEPAYPNDVSSDGLSESDTAQQGNDPHDDDGEHEHGGDHDHADGGDHEHGDEGDPSDGTDDH